MDKVCSIENCDKKSAGRGWCRMHYSRWRRTGTTHLHKTYVCKVDMCDLKHFAKGYCARHYLMDYHNRPITMYKSCLYCDKPVFKGSRWKELHDECKNLRQRQMKLLKVYGITIEDYDALLTYQKNRCAICCKNLSENLHVDHDHISGNVRGLLCGSCNRALGMFRDDPEICINARDYLVMPPNLMHQIEMTQQTSVLH